MKYKSTRGGVAGASFEEALFAGYAPDGGLYVPESVPKLPQSVFTDWKESTPKYQDIVFEVLKLFVSEDELPRDVLRKQIDLAYGQFDTEKVIEIHNCKLSESEDSYNVVELFHGKTKSFKDYGLSLVGRLMEYYVQKRRSHVTILVGTSGDTGSAAIEAVRGLEGVDIIVLYPKGKISRVQELQMITVPENNVHVFGTEGTSDDLDVPIRKCFPSPGIISINSINWARVMIQTAHYIYLSALAKFEPIDIYVPTGAAGNLTAGLVASLLGVPINLYAAQNANNNVETVINKGELIIGGEVIETYANAMDIRHPYNVERLLYFLSDSATVAKIMRGNENGNKGTSIPPEVHEKLRAHVKGAMTVDTPKTLEVIRECWMTNNYLICPHTATAVAYFSSQSRKGENRIGKNKVYVISTASPEKFPDAAKAAHLPNIDCEDDLRRNNNKRSLLEELSSRKIKEPKVMRKGEDWYEILQAQINLVRSKANSNGFSLT